MRGRSWEGRARVNVNVEAVRDGPEERARKGRIPLEAAGEVRWLTELQRSQELVSNGTHKEMMPPGGTFDWPLTAGWGLGKKALSNRGRGPRPVHERPFLRRA